MAGPSIGERLSLTIVERVGWLTIGEFRAPQIAGCCQYTWPSMKSWRELARSIGWLGIQYV